MNIQTVKNPLPETLAWKIKSISEIFAAIAKASLDGVKVTWTPEYVEALDKELASCCLALVNYYD